MADAPTEGGWRERHQGWAEAGGRESWQAWIAEREEELGYKICGRGTRKHEPCGLSAGWGTDHQGYGACKRHGGASLRGAKHANYKDGQTAQGWDAVMPQDLLRHVRNGRETGEVEWLRESVQLTAGRIAQRLEEAQTLGGGAERAQELRDAATETLDAVQQGDADRTMEGLRRIQRMSQARVDRQEAFEEVGKLQEQLRRQVRDLWRVLSDMQMMVRLDLLLERMGAMFDEMKGAVRRRVESEAEQEALLRDMALIMRRMVQQDHRLPKGGPKTKPE